MSIDSEEQLDVELNDAGPSDDLEEDIKEIAGDMDARRKTVSRSPKSLDATQMYLNEIGFSPLLTADEEKALCSTGLIGRRSWP